MRIQFGVLLCGSAGGKGRVRARGLDRSSLLFLIALLVFAVGVGVSVAPNAHAQSPVLSRISLRGMRTLPFEALQSAPNQDTGQTTPPPDGQAPAPPGAPTAPKVELPEGDGKPVATEYCQECHRLTNLVKAHKSEDDWKDTIQTMIERGARIPDDKVDTLVKYLAKNFGPKPATTDPNASAGGASATPTPAAASAAGSSSDSPGASAPPVKVELPDGDGKEIATANCQACHKLTNLTKAHKSLDDWKDTVQLMIERGANVRPDKVDILVQYLAKNFGPKDVPAPPSAAPSSAGPSQ